MTARMTVAEECYNKSFNCLNKVLNMAHDGNFLKETIVNADETEQKEEKKEEEGTPDKKNQENPEETK